MSHLYRSVYPLTQQSTYTQNQVNKFVLSTQGQAILPGSVRITGKCTVSSTSPNITPLAGGSQECYMDPDVGYHALFMKLESGTRAQNTIESLTYYPRLVKTKAVARSYRTSLGVDSFNSIEGKSPNLAVNNGMLQGLGNAGGAADPAVPFSIVPDIWLNKMDAPLPGSKIGNEVIIQFTLATNQQVLFGAAVTSAFQYVLTDLKVQWEAVPEAAVDLKQPINYEKYVDDRQVMNSGVTSINVVAPGGLIDAVHMTYVPQATEYSLTNNFLQCAPPPGAPLYVPTGGTAGTLSDYGIERIIWSINNSDSSLSGFTQDQRDEIFWNALRSLNIEPMSYTTSFEDPYMPDAYLTGIPFGGFLDLMSKRFAVQLYSKCSAARVYICYLFFRSTGQL